MCFYSNVYCFVHCSQLFHVNTVNTIILGYVILSYTWLANCSHETPLSGARRLKGLATELCGPSDQHLETLPLWQATQGLNVSTELKSSFITVNRFFFPQHTPGEGTSSENSVLVLDLFCSVCELHMFMDAVAATLLL